MVFYLCSNYENSLAAVTIWTMLNFPDFRNLVLVAVVVMWKSFSKTLVVRTFPFENLSAVICAQCVLYCNSVLNVKMCRRPSLELKKGELFKPFIMHSHIQSHICISVTKATHHQCSNQFTIKIQDQKSSKDFYNCIQCSFLETLRIQSCSQILCKG